MASENPRRLLEYLAEGLVDDPESVAVEQFEEDDGTIVLELCVAADDYGRVLRRGGGAPHADGRRGVAGEQLEEDDGTIVLELCVAADDYGRVIGRGGRTAHALRTVVKAAAAGEG